MTGYYHDHRVAEAYDRSLGGNRERVTVDDIPFYVELAREATARGETVLELGCGTGRVTIPVAQAGAGIVGLDSSAAMLEVARRKAGDATNPRWLEADMRDFDLNERFGLVIIPFRSFLHMLTPGDQTACLAAISRHLLPGGHLALNVFNPDPRLTALAISGSGPRVYRVSFAEMLALLTQAGFTVEAVYGWFDRRPFTEASSEQVWLARLP